MGALGGGCISFRCLAAVSFVPAFGGYCLLLSGPLFCGCFFFVYHAYGYHVPFFSVKESTHHICPIKTLDLLGSAITKTCNTPTSIFLVASRLPFFLHS
jgi:hypothetical protein